MIVSFLNALWELAQTPQVASAIISVVGLGTIAYYGHKLVRQSAKENVAIAERKLFLDLIKDRTQWTKDSTKHLRNIMRVSMIANSDRFVKAQTEALQSISEIYSLNQNAKWLFGTDVSKKHLEICRAADALYDLRRKMEWTEVAGKQTRLRNDHPNMVSIEKHIKSLGAIDRSIDELLTDYLFMGDISRSTLAIHKSKPPRRWLTWKPRAWNASRTDD